MATANTPVQPHLVRPIPTGPTSLTGPTGPSFRGRGMALGPRGRGGFQQRGGRGMLSLQPYQPDTPLTSLQRARQPYGQRHPCHLTFRRALETKTNIRTETGLRPMSTGWITVADGMPTATRRQRRDHGKHPVVPTPWQLAADTELQEA